MRFAYVVGFLFQLFLMTGCATLTGPYYLESEQYEAGIRAMNEQLREDPNDAASAYYLGRYYLALNKPELGVEYLEKAVALKPDDADYQFWSGVGYWATMNPEKERQAYLRALALNPNHISASLYLGHGYTDEGAWAKALPRYDKVLELDKYNPEALYNRAVVLRGLGRTDEEMAALKTFLEYYPDGSLAMQATQQLNQGGDFSYRNFILGKRNVTLRAISFKPETAEMNIESKESLHVIKAMLKENKQLSLHVVAYAESGELAKARAKAVRDYITNLFPGIDDKRLPLSWFATAERVDVNGKTILLKDSIQFITVVE